MLRDFGSEVSLFCCRQGELTASLTLGILRILLFKKHCFVVGTGHFAYQFACLTCPTQSSNQQAALSFQQGSPVCCRYRAHCIPANALLKPSQNFPKTPTNFHSTYQPPLPKQAKKRAEASSGEKLSASAGVWGFSCSAVLDSG